jgi:hypothetical protein
VLKETVLNPAVLRVKAGPAAFKRKLRSTALNEDASTENPPERTARLTRLWLEATTLKASPESLERLH